MRFGLISDIHGNLVALRTVLDRLGAVDQYWCLGDVVGYGPEPEECVQTLLDLDHVVVVGNHDAAAVGLISTREFNGEARRALEWTARRLSRESVAYLKSAPEQLSRNEILLVHGSPRDPIWEYMTTTQQATEVLGVTDSPYIFVGHTHVPLVFTQDRQGQVVASAPRDRTLLKLGADRLILNPGSVGQPRDGDPRAAYAVVDSDNMTVELHRVEYDVAETQRRMRAAGSSEWLVQRLQHGR
jgi:predicted phosphodiesterase